MLANSPYRIVCLPDSYPDELFYSLIARLRSRLGLPPNKAFSAYCFGTKSAVASVEFPSHLDYFADTLPAGMLLTVEKIIQDHSLLPFYAPFIPRARLELIVRDMKGQNGSSIHMRVGSMAAQTRLQAALRYCPKCLIQDRETFGDGYWHRLHQLPGVIVCPEHCVWLKEFSGGIDYLVNRFGYFAIDDILDLQGEPDTEAPVHPKLVTLARNAQQILCCSILNDFGDSIHEKYNYLLHQKGFCNYSGRIYSSGGLCEAFNTYWGESLLKLIFRDTGSGSNSWLLRLIRRDSKCGGGHPLKHILFMQFLGICPNDLFKIIVPEPFGAPPWPCLNTASDHYRFSSVETVVIKHSKYTNGRPIGTFACYCGFIYSRTGPDLFPDDKFHADKTLSFGDAWNNRLAALWDDPSMSLREIARHLNVDSLTVKRKARSHGLKFPRKGKRKIKALTEKSSVTSRAFGEPAQWAIYRDRWISYLSRFPSLTTTELRRIIPSVYTWLYRHDRDWLQNHKPKTRKRSTNSGRIDWVTRDQELAQLIQNMAQELRDSVTKPRRITVSLLGAATGNLALLQKCLKKLPITASVLENVCESYKAAAIRRISWAAGELIRRGVPVTQAHLIRLAGIGRCVSDPIVKSALVNAVQSYSLENQKPRMEITVDSVLS